MNDRPLLVVDLLGLLVEEEEDDSAGKKDGGAPRHAVGPAELPQVPVAVLQLTGEAHGVDDECDQRENHCKKILPQIKVMNETTPINATIQDPRIQLIQNENDEMITFF